MNETMRIRTIWSIATATALLAMFNVAWFYLSGSFGAAWFVTSLVVYGVLVLGVVYLALFDAGRGTAPAPAREAVAESRIEAQSAPEPELRLAHQEVIYEARNGQALRATYVTPKGATTDYYAIVPREALTVEAIEERLDRIPTPSAAMPNDGEIAAALRRRSISTPRERALDAARPAQESVESIEVSP